MTPKAQSKVVDQESSLPNNKGLVTDPTEELVAELDILREEMGSLIRELRKFIEVIRDNPGDWYPEEIATALEEITNG